MCGKNLDNKINDSDENPYDMFPDNLTDNEIRFISERIKIEYNKQSWRRKLRNIYLGYKFRFEDWVYEIIKKIER